MPMREARLRAPLRARSPAASAALRGGRARQRARFALVLRAPHFPTSASIAVRAPRAARARPRTRLPRERRRRARSEPSSAVLRAAARNDKAGFAARRLRRRASPLLLPHPLAAPLGARARRAAARARRGAKRPRANILKSPGRERAC